ncbi:phytanoyl-CoA dioxygenase family protein [Blastopirellula sp. JC732]|uniref:Phytanoyl-CoA dioxygenase family protein n=1 Tax=Blastopirellula sediminis TaxID=2894196 RepID=A0A9X1MPK8_9BACT|nr:phytanoyl-CoA dioxygenase family protein [Blastopirellula sediminis]MCC9606311.1 phytanoyl-CoA dioxygenase family protein [Blastopirellula sediminis]MCC9630391.1 phytanoyl-CoA dioxygenase family protein [Blastopirellula sediminis]
MNPAAIGKRIGRIFSGRGFFSGKSNKPSTYAERFDLTDHGVILPDLADFPECRQIQQVPSLRNADAVTAPMAAALNGCDVAGFEASLKSLQAQLIGLDAFNAAETTILQTQMKNIRSMGVSYIQHKAQRETTKRDDLPKSAAYESLVEDGVFASQVDTSRIRAHLESSINELVAQEPPELCDPSQGYDRSRMIFPADDAVLFEELHKAFAPGSLLSAASKYHRVPDLDFKHACLHICAPTDTHYTQTLQDCQTTSRLVGLHFDPKPVMKVILYLNDVTPDTGPFCFFPKSHRWRFSELEMVVAKGNSTGNYLNTPEHRRVALSFPQILRKNAILGRMVPDGSPLSAKLLQAEKEYTSDFANCMLFDAGHGFHRGGICKTGLRINLQIALK